MTKWACAIAMATSFIMAAQRECSQWKSVLLAVTFCILIDCAISVEHGKHIIILLLVGVQYINFVVLHYVNDKTKSAIIILFMSWMHYVVLSPSVVSESCGEADQCPHGLVCAPGSVCIPAGNLLTIFEPGFIPLGTAGLQTVSGHTHEHGSTSFTPVHQDYKRSTKTGLLRLQGRAVKSELTPLKYAVE